VGLLPLPNRLPPLISLLFFSSLVRRFWLPNACRPPPSPLLYTVNILLRTHVFFPFSVYTKSPVSSFIMNLFHKRGFLFFFAPSSHLTIFSGRLSPWKEFSPPLGHKPSSCIEVDRLLASMIGCRNSFLFMFPPAIFFSSSHADIPKEDSPLLPCLSFFRLMDLWDAWSPPPFRTKAGPSRLTSPTLRTVSLPLKPSSFPVRGSLLETYYSHSFSLWSTEPKTPLFPSPWQDSASLFVGRSVFFLFPPPPFLSNLPSRKRCPPPCSPPEALFSFPRSSTFTQLDSFSLLCFPPKKGSARHGEHPCFLQLPLPSRP